MLDMNHCDRAGKTITCVGQPAVVSKNKQDAFDEQARLMQLDPEDIWVGGYVDYEWNRLRVILESIPITVKGLKVLEFGCNVGASAILFAYLGAEVCAVDVSNDYVRLARLNAQRYGIDTIQFSCVSDTRALPFTNGHFDLVSCNSVLEYVDSVERGAVQRELDRVLKPGGKILLTGTSNRLWPKEVHSQRWFVNYVPRAFDRFLGKTLQRGIWPWDARHGFGPGYINLDTATNDGFFIRSRLRMGASSHRLRLLTFVASNLRVGPGLLPKNISCLLQKAY